MITYIKGNIFNSPAQVLTNTVNTVGVMGKGIALEFKIRHPEMFQDYKKRCDAGEVKPGAPYLWVNGSTQILNFPTKRHWKDPSRLEDIEEGLKYLASHYQDMEILSIAIPTLGCGLGGLKWENVRPLIEKYLGPLQDLEVYVYEPDTAKSIGQDNDQPSQNTSKRKSDIAAQPL